MIISASRRTDIPAFFAEWFLERLKEGRVEVSNPFYPLQKSVIPLTREEVDAFVFWTRFPKPFFPVLPYLRQEQIPFYFLFTITGYGKPLEKRAPRLSVQIDSFRELKEHIGDYPVIWRYDPIVIYSAMMFDRHLENFDHIARKLSGYTDEVKISFWDPYKKALRNLRPLHAKYEFYPRPDELPGFGWFIDELNRIATGYGMTITSCSEEILANSKTIKAGACIDADRIQRITDRPVVAKKDPSQRPLCRCIVSRDIGMYNTCRFGCLYCYATTDHK